MHHNIYDCPQKSSSFEQLKYKLSFQTRNLDKILNFASRPSLYSYINITVSFVNGDTRFEVHSTSMI